MLAKRQENTVWQGSFDLVYSLNSSTQIELLLYDLGFASDHIKQIRSSWNYFGSILVLYYPTINVYFRSAAVVLNPVLAKW
jgi:hypothetical protein